MEPYSNVALGGKSSWCVVRGRPHRHELGDFLLRWAFAGSPNNTVLVTGTCDRPFHSILSLHGIEWVQDERLDTVRLRPEVEYSPLLSIRLPPLGGQNVERADFLKLGIALLEGDMENFLYENPKYLAKALGEKLEITRLNRQYSISQGRPDIICFDSTRRVCIIECKRGELRRSHIGQVIEYCRADDSFLTNARLILLVNSVSSEVADQLKPLGIEVRGYSYSNLVDAMLAENFTPVKRQGFVRTKGSNPLNESVFDASAWKSNFIKSFNDLLPQQLIEELFVKHDYQDPKKVRICRAQDDFTVLYVASNAGRLEFGLPIIHRLLLAGVPIVVMKTKGPAVYLSKGGQVPSITIEVKSDEALGWIGRYNDEFIDALEHYNEGLSSEIASRVLLHLGATTQDSNASKLQASGICTIQDDCEYCLARR